MSHVEKDAMCCDVICGGMTDVKSMWWCNVMWNMVWCEMCCC